MFFSFFFFCWTGVCSLTVSMFESPLTHSLFLSLSLSLSLSLHIYIYIYINLFLIWYRSVFRGKKDSTFTICIFKFTCVHRPLEKVAMNDYSPDVGYFYCVAGISPGLKLGKFLFWAVSLSFFLFLSFNMQIKYNFLWRKSLANLTGVIATIFQTQYAVSTCSNQELKLTKNFHWFHICSLIVHVSLLYFRANFPIVTACMKIALNLTPNQRFMANCS